MKTFLPPLPLWLAIASLVSPLTGQSVSELELEKSSDLNVWESVTITPEMISGMGKLLVPTAGSQQFYRMKVRLLSAPSISSPPPATTGIAEGESVTFTVESQGEGLTYQWYLGQSGDTSQPIQGATSQTYNTGALTEDTSYWVKVTNDAGSINSETVTVTINRPPSIVIQPSSLSIETGNTATLTVSATGSAPFTYQWYRGTLGATTAPVGTNSSTFTTPALTVTTKYWVKISNAFGEIQSNSVTVTVTENSAPTISDIAAQTINQGNNTGALAFTVGDNQTAAGSLSVSGSSSNTTLVPNANIVFGGSGANRTVTVTPASGQSGTVTITVTVSDGSLSASDTFLLTVNSAPTISDIAAQTINQGNNTGALAFTVGDDQTAAGSLSVSGSSSNTTLVPNANIVFGGNGANRTVTVTPASGQSGTVIITVTVSDGTLIGGDTFLLTVNSAVPTGFALIPQGAFTMGDANDGNANGDAPLVTVNVSAFYMGKYEVTKAEWDEVRTWGLANGYTDLATGGGKASNHPVQAISWFDMVKWCNARSQKEGLTPVYTVSGAVMKTGTTDPVANWSANGYRLPTEAEWEKAARGGVSGKRFPWGTDTISHSQANYYAYAGYSYDLSGSVNNYHPTYNDGVYPYTSPVGSFAANGYGLYDMAGNVWEWCWDWYGSSTYVSGANDPRGPASGSYRVFRGGGWDNGAIDCRVANRNNASPTITVNYVGFRVARSSVP